jgi:hypothetical protein
VTSHDEVKALDELTRIGKITVAGQLRHVRHRVPVSLEDEARYFASVNRRLAEVDRRSVIEQSVKAVNAVRTLDGSSELDSLQRI